MAHHSRAMTDTAQKPLELILARNLLTSVSTPAFLLDARGRMVFYNEAAAALLGRSFEETGQMEAQDWVATFGPISADGTPLPFDELTLTRAIQAGRPGYGTFLIRTVREGDREIEAAAIPIVAAPEGASGAMILFWPKGGNGAA